MLTKIIIPFIACYRWDYYEVKSTTIAPDASMSIRRSEDLIFREILFSPGFIYAWGDTWNTLSSITSITPSSYPKGLTAPTSTPSIAYISRHMLTLESDNIVLSVLKSIRSDSIVVNTYIHFFYWSTMLFIPTSSLCAIVSRACWDVYTGWWYNSSNRIDFSLRSVSHVHRQDSYFWWCSGGIYFYTLSILTART